MKLLIVSEGEHEFDEHDKTGALIELLRQMIPMKFDHEFRKVSDRAVEQVLRPGKSGRHEKRLIGWIRFAERNNFDALALVIDEDGDKSRRTAVEHVQLIQEFIIHKAIGVAIKKFDAWMLADEVALSKVLQCPIGRQKDPEKFKDPKQKFEDLLNTSEAALWQRQAYLEVARELDLDRLAERCPHGFAPFRRNVEQLAARFA